MPTAPVVSPLLFLFGGGAGQLSSPCPACIPARRHIRYEVPPSWRVRRVVKSHPVLAVVSDNTLVSY